MITKNNHPSVIFWQDVELPVELRLYPACVELVQKDNSIFVCREEVKGFIIALKEVLVEEQ